MYKICTLFIFSIIAFPAYSQAPQEKEEPLKLYALCRDRGDSIMLRWLCDDWISWETVKEHGISLERFTVKRSDEFLSGDELRQSRKVIYDRRKIPQLEELNRLSVHLPEAEAAATLLYEFDEAIESLPGFQGIQLQNEDREMRFGLLMFLLDYTFQLSPHLSLGYVDHEIRPEEEYLYRIYVGSIDEPKQKTTVTNNQLSRSALTTSEIFDVEWGDHYVAFRFDISAHAPYISHYRVERSDDEGVSYQQINRNPIAIPVTDNLYKMSISYQDSLPENFKKYRYRVVGETSFNESSPPSDFIEGFGRPSLNIGSPIIYRHQVFGDTIAFEWRIRGGDSLAIQGFSIYRAPHIDSTFMPLHSKPLDSNSRYFTDFDPFPSNYYRIDYTDKYGIEHRGVSQLLQLVDHQPPEVPEAMIGTCDSTGLITLSWRKNQEEDLFGYRVFFATHRENELSQLTVDAVRDTQFKYSANIQTLNRELFFALQAEDNRGNRSDFSELLKIELPDQIPPAPPLISRVESQKKGVMLQMIPSSSDDIMGYDLYIRRSGGDWSILKEWAIDEFNENWLDESIPGGETVYYRLEAIDSANNRTSSQERSGKRIITHVLPGINDLIADYRKKSNSVMLHWSYTGTPPISYRIFRSSGEEELSTYRILQPDELSKDRQGGWSFIDEHIPGRDLYRYQIILQFAGSKMSELSDTVRVDIKK